MAEQKSDFVNPSNRELIDREMEGLVKRIDSIYNNETGSKELAKATKNSVSQRDTLILKMPISKINEKLGNFGSVDEWAYGVYYLEGAPKTGFRKMVDGKWLFIETQNEQDNTLINKYDNALDLAEAIRSENSRLNDPGTVKVEGNKIEVVGTLDYNIKLPSTDLYFDENTGLIKSTITPDYSFELVFVNAHESSLSAGNKESSEGYAAGSGEFTTATTETLGAERERKSLDADDLASENNISISLDDITSTSFEIMREIDEKYSLDENGLYNKESRVSNANEGAGYINSAKNETENEAYYKKVALINAVWSSACLNANGDNQATVVNGVKNDFAFEGDNCLIFKTIQEGLLNNNLDANVIMEKVSQVIFENNLEIQKYIKIAGMFLYLLNEPPIAAGIDFSKAKHHSEYENMVQNSKEKGMWIEEEHEEEKDNDMVMEKIFDFPQNNKNTTY